MKFLIFNLMIVFISRAFAVDADCFSPAYMANSGFTVVSKNVGQGNCTVIHNHENHHALIIDAGSVSDKPRNAEASLMEEFGFSETHADLPLIANTVTVVVSHSDKDHINLFSVLALNTDALTQIGAIYLGDHFSNYYRVDDTRALLSGFFKKVPDVNSKLFSLSHNLAGLNVADYLSDAAFPVVVTADRYQGFVPRLPINRFLTDQQRTNLQNTFEFIGVNAGASKPTKVTDTNANSAVVRLCINGHNILVMGDATGTTTDEILNTIADPAILRADLLIASHHGAEEEDTNYVTWAAVTQPKRVVFSSGFNRGYKHPTLTAVTNYLATGLQEDVDPHQISIYNTLGKHHDALKPNIHGLQWGVTDPIHPEWIICSSRKSVYTTGSSGELRFRFAVSGVLDYFWSQH